jgi:hypothetical protein
VPAGFRRDLGEEVGPREDRPPGSKWHLVGYWVGASPIESGICTVIVSSTDRSEVETRIEVEVACVLD